MGYYKDRPKTNIERIRDAVEDIEANGVGLVATGSTVGAATTLNMTWQDIYDSFALGISTVILVDNGEEYPDATAVVAVYVSSGAYTVKDSNGNVAVTDSADGYPVYDTAGA